MRLIPVGPPPKHLVARRAQKQSCRRRRLRGTCGGGADRHRGRRALRRRSGRPGWRIGPTRSELNSKATLVLIRGDPSLPRRNSPHGFPHSTEQFKGAIHALLRSDDRGALLKCSESRPEDLAAVLNRSHLTALREMRVHECEKVAPQRLGEPETSVRLLPSRDVLGVSKPGLNMVAQHQECDAGGSGSRRASAISSAASGSGAPASGGRAGRRRGSGWGYGPTTCIEWRCLRERNHQKVIWPASPIVPRVRPSVFHGQVV